MTANALMWFRRDLRLADNPALRAAIGWARQRGGAVLPVYIQPDDDGDWADGGASRWWLHHSLASLHASLHTLGSRLVIQRGDEAGVLNRLVADADIGAVFWNRRYEPAAIGRDKHIKGGLKDAGLQVESRNGALLHEPWSIETRNGGPYKVFTPFSKAQKALPIVEPVSAPTEMPAPPGGVEGSRLSSLGLLPTTPWDNGLQEAWTPGEAGAQGLLEEFVGGRLADYPSARDFPARSGTSRLSASLHFGEISPRQAWYTALSLPGEATGSWARQLQWREFGHHLLHHFPHTVTEPLNEAYRAFPWRDDYANDLAAWQRGRTGIPIVDAGMRELWHTGWMHNRVRMLAASLLTKNLLIPWQEGARWFWDTLVDADLANNTLGWQWTAGCGADAAPYFRIFNPVTQSAKFDPQGRYLRRWLPELARLPDKWIHQPWAAPADILHAAGVRLGDDYPKPIVDLAASRQRALDLWAQRDKWPQAIDP